MSKLLNRIAPQDEVLLETDIGTMIPSAEQLAEERVTRFNADKGIRLRVKALEDTVSPDALTQAVERAETAKGDAVKAQGEASKSAEQASTSAKNASKSAEQAEQAKDAIGDVGGRLDALETSAYPSYFADFEGYHQKKYGDNILAFFNVAPAPIGFIAIYATLTPYTAVGVFWIKPNGEVVQLAISNDAHTRQPWMAYNGYTVNACWTSGNFVYFAITRTSNNVVYLFSVEFVGGTPSKLLSVEKVAREGKTLISSGSAYSILLDSGLVITANGDIFNPSTLELEGIVTLTSRRLITPTDGVGALVVTSQGVCRVTAEVGSDPVVTTINGYTNVYPLGNGKYVSVDKTKKSREFTSFGGTSPIPSKCVSGNAVPAISIADIGGVIASPLGIFEPLASGSSGDAIGVNVPRLLFKNPLTVDAYGDGIALKSGGVYFVFSGNRYILVSKEALV